MSAKRQNAAELAQFYMDLKAQLNAWLDSSGTKQAVLASMIGVDASQVSHAVRPSGSMTENFVRRLSSSIPEFSHAYPRFYALKYGTELRAPNSTDAIAARAQKISRLRAAEEEVISAVRALTQAAIDLAARD